MEGKGVKRLYEFEDLMNVTTPVDVHVFEQDFVNVNSEFSSGFEVLMRVSEVKVDTQVVSAEDVSDSGDKTAESEEYLRGYHDGESDAKKALEVEYEKKMQEFVSSTKDSALRMELENVRNALSKCLECDESIIERNVKFCAQYLISAIEGVSTTRFKENKTTIIEEAIRAVLGSMCASEQILIKVNQHNFQEVKDFFSQNVQIRVVEDTQMNDCDFMIVWDTGQLESIMQARIEEITKLVL